MGMLEEARVNLARGAQNGSYEMIHTAGVQASIAIAESLEGVQALLQELVRKADQIDAAVMMIANGMD